MMQVWRVDTHKMRRGHIQVWTHTKCGMAIDRCGHRQNVVWTRTQCGVAIAQCDVGTDGKRCDHVQRVAWT